MLPQTAATSTLALDCKITKEAYAHVMRLIKPLPLLAQYRESSTSGHLVAQAHAHCCKSSNGGLPKFLGYLIGVLILREP